jgi:hypothetical protein
MKKRGRGINNNSKRRSSGHKSKNPQRKTERKSSGIARDKNYYMKWVGIQIVLYAIILFLFDKISANVGWNFRAVPEALILGFVSIIITRIVYSSIYRKEFSFNGVFFWGIIYSFVFGLLRFAVKLLEIGNYWVNLIILSFSFALVITFVRRMKVNTRKKGKKRSKLMGINQQIFTGLFLMFLSIMFFRFSHIIWIDWFNWPEGLAWSWFLGIVCMIGGILTLVAWWRNNVSMFTTKHSVNWK